ncbi:MAG: ABC transporter ATP-binding protein [Acidimicrobiales bacterium]
MSVPTDHLRLVPPVDDTAALLRVRSLRVATERGADVVADISFDLRAGEVLGIAGESGCGKSTVALALLGYCRPGLRIEGGSVEVDGVDLLSLDEAERRRFRGRRVAYVSQDASKALNPSLRVRDLIGEVMTVHGTGGTDADVELALQRVDLPSDRRFLRRFPHQLSGGQQQRLAIGVALACRPSVIVLDEPTTGLDVITQAHVLDEVRRICHDESVAAVFVSHDLAAMSSLASRIAVLYAGRVVEEQPPLDLVRAPRHPYTAGLIGSVPVHTRPEHLTGIPGVAVGVSERPTGCAFAPRCALRTDECEQAMPPLEPIGEVASVRCLHWRETTPSPRFARDARRDEQREHLLEVSGLQAVHGAGATTVVAARDVSFTIAPGECVALVGESGSGKSTIARCVAGLHVPAAGSITFAGTSLAGAARDRGVDERRRMQVVFQNPYDSLNPTRTVAESVSRPMELFLGLSRAEAKRRLPALMERVRLPARLADRYPRELSGGERQRVAIARALAAEPDLMICDEVTSSLDVSVQAAVLDVLSELEVAMLFITHDLGVVASIADHVLVLQRGEIREAGDVEHVLLSPSSDYARSLLAAIPEMPLPSPMSEPEVP